MRCFLASPGDVLCSIWFIPISYIHSSPGDTKTPSFNMVQAQLMIFIKSNGYHAYCIGICYFVFARSCLPSMQELSPHALYMRLKRLCGRTAAGKLQVPESIHNQWLTGSRDELLLALTRSLKTHGFDPQCSHAQPSAGRVGQHFVSIMFLAWCYCCEYQGYCCFP